jgi:hypothetical protein
MRATRPLQKRDSLHRIKLTNIAEASFSLQIPGSSCTGMVNNIYGHRPDDGWITGVHAP